MERTIRVTGTGRATARPDRVVISLSLEARKMQYDPAMELAAQNIDKLRRALVKTGFAEEDLKTTNFNVRTEYRPVQQKNGGFRQEFNGYVVSHDLKLEFDLDMERLSAALSVISESGTNPRLSIRFTVKDPTMLDTDMLISAAENARKKAEILCIGSGVALGELLSVDYSWGELNVYSPTRYGTTEFMAPTAMMDAAPRMAKTVDMEPEDITVQDTATFVWAIAAKS